MTVLLVCDVDSDAGNVGDLFNNAPTSNPECDSLSDSSRRSHGPCLYIFRGATFLTHSIRTVAVNVLAVVFLATHYVLHSTGVHPEISVEVCLDVTTPPRLLELSSDTRVPGSS